MEKRASEGGQRTGSSSGEKRTFAWGHTDVGTIWKPRITGKSYNMSRTGVQGPSTHTQARGARGLPRAQDSDSIWDLGCLG